MRFYLVIRHFLVSLSQNLQSIYLYHKVNLFSKKLFVYGCKQ
jgi:hypothetical protein